MKKIIVETKVPVFIVALLVAGSATLGGCAGVLFGTAATGAAVAHDQRTTGTFIEDQAIELKAFERIRSDDDLEEQAHVSVTSYNQIVLLTGQTPTEELRQKAVSIVATVPKVRHVYDELSIAAPSSLTTRSSDTLLTAKVKTKLFTLERFDATRVKVVSENGIVYLMGLLTRDEGNTVATAASEVGGVQKVVKLFESSK